MDMFPYAHICVLLLFANFYILEFSNDLLYSCFFGWVYEIMYIFWTQSLRWYQRLEIPYRLAIFWITAWVGKLKTYNFYRTYKSPVFIFLKAKSLNFNLFESISNPYAERNRFSVSSMPVFWCFDKLKKCCEKANKKHRSVLNIQNI